MFGNIVDTQPDKKIARTPQRKPLTKVLNTFSSRLASSISLYSTSDKYGRGPPVPASSRRLSLATTMD